MERRVKQGRGSSEGYLIHVTLTCLHLSVPCLLAQLTAPNMVQCWARLHYANAKGETMVHFNGIVLLRQSSSTQDAVSEREKQASPGLT